MCLLQKEDVNRVNSGGQIGGVLTLMLLTGMGRQKQLSTSTDRVLTDWMNQYAFIPNTSNLGALITLMASIIGISIALISLIFMYIYTSSKLCNIYKS